MSLQTSSNKLYNTTTQTKLHFQNTQNKIEVCQMVHPNYCKRQKAPIFSLFDERNQKTIFMFVRLCLKEWYALEPTFSRSLLSKELKISEIQITFPWYWHIYLQSYIYGLCLKISLSGKIHTSLGWIIYNSWWVISQWGLDGWGKEQARLCATNNHKSLWCESWLHACVMRDD